jgi:germination protein M
VRSPGAGAGPSPFGGRTRPPSNTLTGRGRRLLPLIAVLLLAVVGCDRGGAVTGGVVAPEGTPTIQPDDVVDLTVYFREGSGAGAFLVPVTREVDVTEDLPRTAVELLLAGPREDDGASLSAPVPPGTRLLGLEVDGAVATVDFSVEMIRAAGEVGASAENELLALAAVADTLTEFPAIERVQVLVEGRAEGWRSGVDIDRFWGGWGLPAVLVRDESVIGPPREGDGVPDLAQFTTEGQQAGANDAGPVQVTSIRARDRITFLRVIVELADSADPDGVAMVPSTRARSDGKGGVRLQISDVVALEANLSRNDGLDLAQYGFRDLRVGAEELPGDLTVTLTGDEERPFRLQSMTSPTRVVLDVKK